MTPGILQPLIVKQRKNGAQNVEGILMRIVPPLRHLSAQYGVEFPDSNGVLEWFDFEDIVTEPQQMNLL